MKKEEERRKETIEKEGRNKNKRRKISQKTNKPQFHATTEGFLI